MLHFPPPCFVPRETTTSDSTSSHVLWLLIRFGQWGALRRRWRREGKRKSGCLFLCTPNPLSTTGHLRPAAPPAKGHSFSERWPSAHNSFWEGELLPGPSLLLARCQQFPYPLLTPKLSFIQSFSSCPILSTPSVSLWDWPP